MPDMSWQSSGYRYGFGGHEMDNDVKGTGNHSSFGDYGYDNRTGRRWMIEPMISKYPSLSPYVAYADNPILYSDPSGLEIHHTNDGFMTSLLAIMLETDHGQLLWEVVGNSTSYDMYFNYNEYRKDFGHVFTDFIVFGWMTENLKNSENEHLEILNLNKAYFNNKYGYFKKNRYKAYFGLTIHNFCDLQYLQLAVIHKDLKIETEQEMSSGTGGFEISDRAVELFLLSSFVMFHESISHGIMAHLNHEGWGNEWLPSILEVKNSQTPFQDMYNMKTNSGEYYIERGSHAEETYKQLEEMLKTSKDALKNIILYHYEINSPEFTNPNHGYDTPLAPEKK